MWIANSMKQSPQAAATSQMLGEYLDAFPAQIFAHLTFPSPCSAEERDTLLKCWIRRVQKEHRATVGYIVGQERWPVRHVHAALLCHTPLLTDVVKGSFRDILRHPAQAGVPSLDTPGSTYAVPRNCIEAEKYVKGKGGMSYVIKGIDSDNCDVIFSPNLHLFAPVGLRPARIRTSSRERRQARRVLPYQLEYSCPTLPAYMHGFQPSYLRE
jgi:hypothetical protein